MDERNRRAFLVGAVGTIAIFAVLFFAVGARDIVDSLLSAKPSLVVATFAFALGWLVAWSLMLRTVLAALGVDVPVGKSFLVYSGAVFANNVTPFGQAGGEPVAALLISKVSDARYETGLVGIASVDVLNVVPSISLILVGVGYYATTAALGETLETAVSSAIVLIAGIVVAMGLVWRYHETIIDRLPGIIAPRLGKLGIERFQSDTLEADIADRLDRFFENIERVATDRWRLAAVVGLSLCGWLFQVAALTAAFAALGYSVPPYVLLFVIPLANLAGAAPLPGGLGGIEAAFVTLLVPTTGIPASVITAAVLIFRGAIYWMPVLIGGLSVSSLGVRALR
ncbi:flippase-like domain-containing protein [Natrinema thermotolerans]|uniref:Flippase-like domain-containing protein n=1 Tax=Natrinema thermotolerans TaxID=121872 RepID=A0AAF0PGM2_9EURY|nr:lysylphosphatidylglycerol synthase transmembrane domain-containing protein [Natrinema thermotolerans]QCC60602.1 TIGR00374 family protein [Natrinema thermotolerans]QCC61488.1 TIGR00374 family protein [Natrinema thermotolerans]WMT07646.1 flippase-like domain-containing protein [Natrinema thermotolerans]WMT08278.1 flippase-like domain-containing protein [Natrinema thermotolerans]